MVRPPFAARVMTGLLVTAIEETRKLPTTAVTLPMTAVSTTVQVAMRLQQNIAELAIKGDDALDHWFHRAQEQPSWATFDEDLDALRVDDLREDDLREDDRRDDEPGAPPALTAVPDEAPTTAADAPVLAEPPTPATTTPANKAPAKKTPAKKAPAAKKAAAKKAPAKKVVVPAAESATTETPGSDGDDDSATVSAKGRFALYSSAPDTVLQSEVDAAPTPTPKDAPEIVEYLDYDSLTLAQLRAKIRSIDLDDLRTLAEYERSHRGRAPFATMLDNRITAAGAK
ncbi:MAG: lipid droplet-associated protein [Gordonia paraffinivorans]